MRINKKKYWCGLLLLIVFLLSACGEGGSVVTTTTAPTAITTVETTTTAKTSTTTAEITTTTTTVLATVTEQKAAVTIGTVADKGSFGVSTESNTETTTTVFLTDTTMTTKTKKTIPGTPTTTTLPTPELNLLTPSEDKQQLVARLKGEDVLFTFSNAETKPSGNVVWYYKGLTTDGLGATCYVLAQQERIYGIKCSFPDGLSATPQKDEASTFVLSELDSWGFVTDGAEVDVTTSLSDKQVTGRFAYVRVTLADAPVFFAEVRKFGEALYLCSFGTDIEELNHPLLIPNWITE